jgi:hypothetical protein
MKNTDTPTASNATAVMTRDDAATYVGVAPSTMARWWAADVGPRGIKLSSTRTGRVLYARAELDRFVADGMTLRPGTARPACIPPGCFTPPAYGRRPRNTSGIDPRQRPD